MIKRCLTLICLVGIFNLWNIANVSARVCFLPDSKDCGINKTDYNEGENKLGCTYKEKSDVKLGDCEVAYQSGMCWYAKCNVAVTGIYDNSKDCQTAAQNSLAAWQKNNSKTAQKCVGCGNCYKLVDDSHPEKSSTCKDMGYISKTTGCGSVGNKVFEPNGITDKNGEICGTCVGKTCAQMGGLKTKSECADDEEFKYADKIDKDSNRCGTCEKKSSTPIKKDHIVNVYSLYETSDGKECLSIYADEEVKVDLDVYYDVKVTCLDVTNTFDNIEEWSGYQLQGIATIPAGKKNGAGDKCWDNNGNGMTSYCVPESIEITRPEWDGEPSYEDDEYIYYYNWHENKRNNGTVVFDDTVEFACEDDSALKCGTADFYTGQELKAYIYDASGKEVWNLSSGNKQISLPAGKYTLKCSMDKLASIFDRNNGNYELSNKTTGGGNIDFLMDGGIQKTEITVKAGEKQDISCPTFTIYNKFWIRCTACNGGYNSKCFTSPITNVQYDSYAGCNIYDHNFNPLPGYPSPIPGDGGSIWLNFGSYRVGGVEDFWSREATDIKVPNMDNKVEIRGEEVYYWDLYKANKTSCSFQITCPSANDDTCQSNASGTKFWFQYHVYEMDSVECK